MVNDLRWLQTILDDSGETYWLDGGSLLGVIREQSLIAGDGDLDLSMKDPSVATLRLIGEEGRKRGYFVREIRFAGVLYKLKLVPRKSEHGILVDISVFQEFNDILWRAHARGGNPWKRLPAESLARYVAMLHPLGLWKRFMHQLIRPRTRRLDAARWPWRTVTQVGTWIIPTALIEPTNREEALGLTLCVPGRVDDYLTYRYGNWRVPVQDWSFWEHDGALWKYPPEEALRLYRSGPNPKFSRSA